MDKIRIILSGYRGRLGSAVARAAEERDGFAVVCGVDPRGGEEGFPTYSSLSDVTEDADVLIDASHHSATADLLAFASSRRTPVVICTTGHTEDEIDMIKKASGSIPILKSRNMSVGINVLLDLVRRAAAALGDEYDAEIVEAHHRKKLDAPSGTALMLADAVKDVRPCAEYIYSRNERRQERGDREIGIHSIRGGTIVGEHSVIFAGDDEVITISHSAGSRDLFASGALRAASFLVGREPGYYTMADAVSE
ncbi:MAG: 4-hydroxy-tetrahydrodipicolinate reductase [Clostridia bacterium]|nr:4-hydroxy-tetrahydrodipicolinate reductase [Clostridia bacterium]